MMAINAPLLYAVAGGTLLNSFAASVAVIILSSLGILVMRRFVSLLPLSRRDLIVTFGLHSLRIVLGLIFTALLWKLPWKAIASAAGNKLGQDRMRLARRIATTSMPAATSRNSAPPMASASFARAARAGAPIAQFNPWQYCSARTWRPRAAQ
ncbi:hypothetical protein [Escherichia coli]|uniref:hypothetical protein n=1 Tax=Escherichia coli TaxID=562 RepID=UPI0013F5AA8C|nr:hypothetical protein [Escherichia coli]QIL68347.1 hypothetical protein F0L67_28255 [Escherichia coli]